MSSSNLFLFGIKFESDISPIQLVEKLENDILDETRFVIDNYSEYSCSGVYIYTLVYKISEYNFETSSFQVVTRKKYVTAEFHIDMKNEMMDIWGSSQNAKKIITALSLALDNKIIIEPLGLSFCKIIDYLSNQRDICIGKVTASQIPINDGVLADCTFDMSNNEQPFGIIEKYKKNIVKISFKWKCEGAFISMMVHTTGALKIYRLRHSVEDRELKKIYELLEYARR